MANPLWPVSNNMPQDITLGVDSKYADNVISFQPDKGTTLNRARYLAVSRFYEGCKLYLTSAQRDDLVTFWETTTRFGTIKFEWKDPFSQTSKECKISNYSDRALMPVPNGLFECTFDLEVLP